MQTAVRFTPLAAARAGAAGRRPARAAPAAAARPAARRAALPAGLRMGLPVLPGRAAPLGRGSVFCKADGCVAAAWPPCRAPHAPRGAAAPRIGPC